MTKNNTEKKMHSTCTVCYQSKVKCVPLLRPDSDPCELCVKRNKKCIDRVKKSPGRPRGKAHGQQKKKKQQEQQEPQQPCQPPPTPQDNEPQQPEECVSPPSSPQVPSQQSNVSHPSPSRHED